MLVAFRAVKRADTIAYNQSSTQNALISTLSSGSMDVTIGIRVLGKTEDRTRMYPQQRPQSRHSVHTEQSIKYI